MDPITNPYASPEADILPNQSRIDAGELSYTALGLSLVYFGLVLIVLGLIVSAVSAVVPVGIFVAVGAMLIGGILAFVGPLFCLSVPGRSNARGLIIGTVIFQFLNVGITVVRYVQNSQGGEYAFTTILGLASTIVQALAAILFILFMRKLAQYVDRQDLVKNARNLFIVGGVLALISVAAYLLVFMANRDGLLLIMVIGLLSLILFVMYANLVNNLRKALKVEMIVGASPFATIEEVD